MGDMRTRHTKLRLITYMVPGIPLELYQVYQHYLEEALDTEAQLAVESRWSGPSKNRTDPFTLDEVDIAFMCSTIFLRLVNQKNQWLELLNAAPIHIYPKGNLQPVYFSEVIILSSNRNKYKELGDLEGQRWAYNDEESLSGSLSAIVQLKKINADASFFSQVIHSGSHSSSIMMVLNGQVDAAAIDSNTLGQYLNKHPEDKERLHVLCSWGPWPVPPIVVNTRLPDEMKQKITCAFLDINKHPKWKAKLSQYNVWGFKPVGLEHYTRETEIQKVVKDVSFNCPWGACIKQKAEQKS